MWGGPGTFSRVFLKKKKIFWLTREILELLTKQKFKVPKRILISVQFSLVLVLFFKKKKTLLPGLDGFV